MDLIKQRQTFIGAIALLLALLATACIALSVFGVKNAKAEETEQTTDVTKIIIKCTDDNGEPVAGAVYRIYYGKYLTPTVTAGLGIDENNIWGRHIDRVSGAYVGKMRTGLDGIGRLEENIPAGIISEETKNDEELMSGAADYDANLQNDSMTVFGTSSYMSDKYFLGRPGFYLVVMESAPYGYTPCDDMLYGEATNGVETTFLCNCNEKNDPFKCILNLTEDAAGYNVGGEYDGAEVDIDFYFGDNIDFISKEITRPNLTLRYAVKDGKIDFSDTSYLVSDKEDIAQYINNKGKIYLPEGLACIYIPEEYNSCFVTSEGLWKSYIANKDFDTLPEDIRITFLSDGNYSPALKTVTKGDKEYKAIIKTASETVDTYPGVIFYNTYGLKEDGTWAEYKDVLDEYTAGSSTLNIFIPVSIKIKRLAGADRYETSIKTAEELKKVLGVNRFDNIVVASGRNFADALSGSYLAAKKNAPMLLVEDGSMDLITEYIRNNISSNGKVYILGGGGAVSYDITSKLSGIACKRLEGSDRYETNLEILKEVGMNDECILVCTGKNFADCLSASATGRPILLVPDRLTDSQVKFLDSLDKKYNYYVIGGESAVNTEIENAMKKYGNTYRVAGKDRFETSVAVAVTFAMCYKKATLAYAGNFPDGLSAGPLAYAVKSPLLLTANNDDYYKKTVSYTATKTIKHMYVLGGETLVSRAVAKDIFLG